MALQCFVRCRPRFLTNGSHLPHASLPDDGATTQWLEAALIRFKTGLARVLRDLVALVGDAKAYLEELAQRGFISREISRADSFRVARTTALPHGRLACPHATIFRGDFSAWRVSRSELPLHRGGVPLAAGKCHILASFSRCVERTRDDAADEAKTRGKRSVPYVAPLSERPWRILETPQARPATERVRFRRRSEHPVSSVSPPPAPPLVIREPSPYDAGAPSPTLRLCPVACSIQWPY